MCDELVAYPEQLALPNTRAWFTAAATPVTGRADADWAQDANVADQKAARERFDKLKAAYEVLRNPETRRQYDQGNPVRPA